MLLLTIFDTTQTIFVVWLKATITFFSFLYTHQFMELVQVCSPVAMQ